MNMPIYILEELIYENTADQLHYFVAYVVLPKDNPLWGIDLDRLIDLLRDNNLYSPQIHVSFKAKNWKAIYHALYDGEPIEDGWGIGFDTGATANNHLGRHGTIEAAKRLRQSLITLTELMSAEQ